LLVYVEFVDGRVSNFRLRAVVWYLLLSVLLSGGTSYAHEEPRHIEANGLTATAGASAPIVNLGISSCEELRLRTMANLYTSHSVGQQDRRLIDAKCTRIEAQGQPRLTVEYRSPYGNVVTVTLDDGAVSVAPRESMTHKAGRVVGSHVDRLDVLLNYE
jgi:hypothetical protein